MLASQVNAANTALTVTVTYSDATTDAAVTGAASAAFVFGNDGGMQRIAASALVAHVTLQTKDVTRIQITTLGTGTGLRAASVAALQVRI